MVELTPAEQDRLRKLEDEVDQERETLRKRREEIERKVQPETALVPVDASREKTALVKPQPPSNPAPSPWRKNLRRNVTVVAAAVMAGFFVLHNLVFIAGAAIVVGGVWYAVGRYLTGEKPKRSDDASDDNKV